MIEEKSFALFYERTRHGLWGYIARSTNGGPETDDIFQDSYIRFIQSDVDQQDEGRMKSYLYRIATNLIRDSWRKSKRTVRLFESGGGTAGAAGDIGTVEDIRASADSRAVELRHDLTEAFKSLALRQRQMLWLAYAEDHTHEEIARILNIRELSVKVLLFRARRRLVEILREIGFTKESAS